MKLMTTENIDEKYEVLGLVQGNVVRSKNIGRDIMAGFKNLVGGEIKAYTEMMTESRQIATDRMVKEAEDLKADAVIALRYVSAMVLEGCSEIIAYGTAIKYKK